MTEATIQIGTDVDDDGRVSFPVEDVLTSRGVLFGRSGGGKSNTAGVVIEQLLARGHAVMIVDPDGEYYGLKEEYDVLLATGDDAGDIQVGPEHAEHLADLALKENVPVILDVSAFLDPEDADELVGKVARALFVRAKKLRKPFLFVVEEAHEYVPQSGGGGFAVDHITRIAKRGRKHGLGFLGISQRPANVDKDVVTQCNWLIWHSLKWKNDINEVREMYGSEIADRVRELDPGAAYVDAEWLDTRRWVQVDEKETFDAGDTPGLDDEDRPALRSIDDTVLESLREAGGAAKSREERIEQLEQRIADREERIQELETENERLEERNAWEEQMAERAFEGIGGEIGIDLGEGSIRAEVLEIIEERDELDETAERRERELEAARGEIEQLEAKVSELEAELEEAVVDEELQQLREDLRELALDRYPDLLGVETDERVADLRQQLEHERERVEELEQRRPDEVVLEADLLANDVVRDHIDEVAAESRYSDETVWDVVIALSSLADGKHARVSEIEPQVSLAEKSVLDIANQLAEYGVATKGREGRTNVYALDREALRDLVRVTDQQRTIAEQRQRIRAGSPSAQTTTSTEAETEREEATDDGGVQEADADDVSDVGAGDPDDRVDVQTAMLAEFQEEAVERLMEKVEGLSSGQMQLLKYIESRARTLDSQKAWARRALGLDSDPNSRHYDEMGELLDAGFVRKNNDGTIKPNLRGLLETELDGYELDADDVDDTYEDVLERIADGSS